MNYFYFNVTKLILLKLKTDRRADARAIPWRTIDLSGANSIHRLIIHSGSGATRALVETSFSAPSDILKHTYGAPFYYLLANYDII